MSELYKSDVGKLGTHLESGHLNLEVGVSHSYISIHRLLLIEHWSSGHLPGEQFPRAFAYYRFSYSGIRLEHITYFGILLVGIRLGHFWASCLLGTRLVDIHLRYLTYFSNRLVVVHLGHSPISVFSQWEFA